MMHVRILRALPFTHLRSEPSPSSLFPYTAYDRVFPVFVLKALWRPRELSFVF